MTLKSSSKNLAHKHTSYQKVVCDTCNQHVTATMRTLTAVTHTAQRTRGPLLAITSNDCRLLCEAVSI
jgi:hypothetical protein